MRRRRKAPRRERGSGRSVSFEHRSPSSLHDTQGAQADQEPDKRECRQVLATASSTDGAVGIRGGLGVGRDTEVHGDVQFRAELVGTRPEVTRREALTVAEDPAAGGRAVRLALLDDLGLARGKRSGLAAHLTVDGGAGGARPGARGGAHRDALRGDAPVALRTHVRTRRTTVGLRGSRPRPRRLPSGRSGRASRLRFAGGFWCRSFCRRLPIAALMQHPDDLDGGRAHAIRDRVRRACDNSLPCACEASEAPRRWESPNLVDGSEDVGRHSAGGLWTLASDPLPQLREVRHGGPRPDDHHSSFSGASDSFGAPQPRSQSSTR